MRVSQLRVQIRLEHDRRTICRRSDQIRSGRGREQTSAPPQTCVVTMMRQVSAAGDEPDELELAPALAEPVEEA